MTIHTRIFTRSPSSLSLVSISPPILSSTALSILYISSFRCFFPLLFPFSWIDFYSAYNIFDISLFSSNKIKESVFCIEATIRVHQSPIPAITTCSHIFFNCHLVTCGSSTHSSSMKPSTFVWNYCSGITRWWWSWSWAWTLCS